MPASTLIVCQECDLPQWDVAVPPGGSVLCRRCGALLYRRRAHGIDHTLAFTLGAALLFVPAMAFPLLAIDSQGVRGAVSLPGAVHMLWQLEMRSMAVLVFMTLLLFPAIELAVTLCILIPLRQGWKPAGAALFMRLLRGVQPWGALDVFVLGLLVSYVKLSHLASVIPGVAAWCFGGLILLLSAASASFDAHAVWARLDLQR